MEFIKVTIKDYIIMHGFDENNKEIEEVFSVPEWSEKLIAVDRIMSVSEKFILTTYAGGRIIYWQYEGGLKHLSNQLAIAKPKG